VSGDLRLADEPVQFVNAGGAPPQVRIFMPANRLCIAGTSASGRYCVLVTVTAAREACGTLTNWVACNTASPSGVGIEMR
jgi:hypothetical protein